MDQMLTDQRLRGKVTCLTEMRDTVGLTMLDMGYDIEDFTFEQFDKAIAKLQTAVDSGQIRRFTGNDYGADLAAGNVIACVGWTGDVISLQADSPNLQLVVPDAGCTLWSDNFVIPIRTPHKANAEKLIDWYFQPEIAAEAADYIAYISPVVGVREAMAELDPGAAGGSAGLPRRVDPGQGQGVHGADRRRREPVQPGVRHTDGCVRKT